MADGLPLAFPELELIFQRIVDRWAQDDPDTQAASNLTVTVRSFAFKRGYPEDTEGHGGGSVFDCRGLPNPGRLPEMVNLTGLDDSVIDILDGSSEVQEFWENVRGIVEMQVESYLSRGFSSLSVSFGCTGGQHRSVFMAGKLTEHLQLCFPHVRVQTNHREL